jgi:hypothetical protein
MAKVKINTDLITCDAFWQPEKVGDKISGVMLTMNMVEDLKSKTGYRPLYVLALLEAKPKNCYMDKEEVKDLKKGDIVGINGAAKIDMAIRKLGGAKRVCGHEIEIEFLGKKKIETGTSKGNDVKEYNFSWDDAATKEFASKVVMPDPFMKGGAEEIPF